VELTLSGLRQRSYARPLAFGAWALIVVLAISLAVWVEGALNLRPGPNEFNVPAWEARNFVNKWLYGAGELFRSDRSADQENAELTQFFAAIQSVESLERDPSRDARSRLADATAERNELENKAEATIEARITEIADREGLTRGLGPLPDMVWPPVDLEFTTPPRTLAVSPRDRIELKDTTLLREGLDMESLIAIERRREARDDVSALAFPTSGVGAYPTLVTYADSYSRAVEIAAHEWIHNYLAFRPLGQRYYDSNDLRTMNETVADLVGREIAAAVVAEWPLSGASATEVPGTNEAGSGLDLRAELVKLRGEVDALLAEGKIEEAEALMEERRQFLASNGHYIRRINQAYFAFANLYAGESGSPAAVSPIGPKIDELRRQSASLAAFLSVAGNLTSVEDLDAALAQQ
jgi:hypothetical protein